MHVTSEDSIWVAHHHLRQEFSTHGLHVALQCVLYSLCTFFYNIPTLLLCMMMNIFPDSRKHTLLMSSACGHKYHCEQLQATA